MKTAKKGRLIAIAILLILTLAINFACAYFSSAISTFMTANLNPLLTGKKAVESAEILSVAEATEHSLAMAEKLENEGIVLLRNENNALPLASGTKVNLFGYASVDPIYGGTGSGSGDTSANVDVVKGLTNAGLVVNEELVNFYKNAGVSRVKQGGYTGSNFTPAEVPADKYTESVLSSARAYADVAVIVLSRIGGEGGDLPTDMFAAGYSKTDDGRHYLELTQDEEDLIALVKAQDYEKVIVLINSSNAMELGFVEDGIDACLWVGSPGAVGFNSVGNVLTGAVNPSGRLTDTYAYDLTTSPAYYNAGSFTYSNLKRNYVEYAEGIYVGYRYYETAAADGFIDYDSTVQYPFGYGLSYTTFEQSIENFVDGGASITVQVKVTNTGSVAGKDVAQVYYTAPYTKGGIEKAHVVLAGFAKTKLLGPGESQVLTISFLVEDMASFDSKGSGCYVLEAGSYIVRLMNNSHEMIDSREHTVAQTVVYGDGHARSTDKNAAVVRFADVEDGQIINYVSRADWEGTMPKAREDGKEASAAVVDAFTNKAAYAVNTSDATIVYADNGLRLEDMAGLAWDDPKWDLLLQQLSDEDMTNMILNGGWSTPAVESVGKPATSDLDGPAGINSLVSSLKGVSFPSEAVIGATWNEELVEEFGKEFGAEALANGVVGLYAPGMNIHRTPFSGRNFEYYSEDGLLSGKLGAAQVRGSASQGVYCYAKHYALNDQESNRLSLSVWANEQAMRELYFKPFEITVKEGKTTAMMSSYSHLGTTWAGASKALITDVLRSEWGFVGMVVTDSAMANTSWMDPNLAVRAGNDMMLCLMGASIDSSNNTARQAMRAASHNILYTQANSAAVKVEADNTPYWYCLVALFNAIMLSVILILLLKAFGVKKLGWIGLLIFVLVIALSLLLTWALYLRSGSPARSAQAGTEAAAEPQQTEEPAEPAAPAEAENTKPVEAENAEPAEVETADDGAMELYELANGWLGCHVNINADNTFTVAYDYNAENAGIVSDSGKWEKVSDTEMVLHSDSGTDIPVTLANGKWSCEVTESNTQTVCHPSVEAGVAAAAEAEAVMPEAGMELYDLADYWLGCHVNINADNTFTVAYDYNAENAGIVSMAGTWERISDTELTLHPDGGDDFAVILADGKWSCEVTEPNTQTVCHPSVEAGAAAAVEAEAVTPEAGMELYDLADYWLGCHVYINADNTYRLTYDYNAENSDIESDSGTWERVSDTELSLHSAGGTDIPVTLADGKWSCEVTEPNTQTVCHPSVKADGKTEAAPAEPEQPEKVTYMVVFTDAEGTVYNAIETTDTSVIPETEIPTKEGFLFAGWQTRPEVTKEDLILGVSPYEVPLGASSLYGGAGTSITDLESLSGTMLLLYARWVEPTEIHNAEELKGMADDLCGWYVLVDDIDLAGENWQPMGIYFSNYETVNAPYWTYAFRGTFDGAGHTISNLTITMDGCAADLSAFENVTPVWRNDGEALGSEAAFFGALAKATVCNVTFEKAVVAVTSDNDATPYAAVVGGFDLASTLKNITVNEAKVSITAGDANSEKRASAWAAASAFIAGGWSDYIEDCAVNDAEIILNGVLEKSHGGEFYVGSVLGEGYAFMDHNTASAVITVDVQDESTAEKDADLIVNVGGMGGTNTTQTNGSYDTAINLHVVKPAGASVISVGGLTGSQRYQVAEDNTVKAQITTDLQLDEANSKVYVGKVIGSTNIPYCIVQLIFAGPGDVAYSGCRNNTADVTLNGEEVTLSKGQILTVSGEELQYIANGDITSEELGGVLKNNIDAVIAEYGSAVPASFLQKAAIVLVDEGEWKLVVSAASETEAAASEEAAVPEETSAEDAAEPEESAAAPESVMELYELANGWLGCHVNINADDTFTVAYDFNAENAGIVCDSGRWEQVSDTEMVLHSDSGTDIPVTLTDGVWSCEVTEPNTQTVCHPQG